MVQHVTKGILENEEEITKKNETKTNLQQFFYAKNHEFQNKEYETPDLKCSG